ncbi:four-carbon acid sugar kinase family protein [Paenibacillus campi]|uniref:four-carbon acid sugar kinase family protein n=1 Tax=Paenibacillus campi TaxID=3106031 RepID=UPI002AFFCED0|nr:four-carbon acid sugar kinase family protein [Paenibacillus sp. SGZ-1014]
MNIYSSKTTLEQLTQHLPAEAPLDGARQQIAEWQQQRNRKIIVLDDDPTGVQTVHDIYVLTQWDEQLLRQAFLASEPVFYILTNTRGMDAENAERINREIAANVCKVADEVGQEFTFVSRSDSMLRGYYPLEIDVLTEEISQRQGYCFDGHLIIPAFLEGGRFTINNTHYMLDHDVLVPVHETEFAQDRVFGYNNGDLTEWVAEKTANRFTASQCLVISLEQLRSHPQQVDALLMQATDNVPIIVNVISYADMDLLSLALLRAEQNGKRFIFRTAASFVKSYAGISDVDYVPAERLIADAQSKHGGIVIVGSYVQKTTRQLEQLLQLDHVLGLEMNVEHLLDDANREQEIQRVQVEANTHLSNGTDVVVYSSRRLITANSNADNFQISATVSAALVHIVQSLQVAPKFIIAKGGITSSDVATRGLSIKRALVLGQVSAGIPVWLTGAEAKFNGIPYIVFPGNVGNDTTLRETVETIQQQHS